MIAWLIALGPRGSSSKYKNSKLRNCEWRAGKIEAAGKREDDGWDEKTNVSRAVLSAHTRSYSGPARVPPFGPESVLLRRRGPPGKLGSCLGIEHGVDG